MVMSMISDASGLHQTVIKDVNMMMLAHIVLQHVENVIFAQIQKLTFISKTK